jgi:hypothetical protein
VVEAGVVSRWRAYIWPNRSSCSRMPPGSWRAQPILADTCCRLLLLYAAHGLEAAIGSRSPSLRGIPTAEPAVHGIGT